VSERRGEEVIHSLSFASFRLLSQCFEPR
jgi:hypothetical protein